MGRHRRQAAEAQTIAATTRAVLPCSSRTSLSGVALRLTTIQLTPVSNNLSRRFGGVLGWRM